ncbi:PucR family transcriptional regulator ligand-binding domain-containing protein [Micromonospora sp. WMMA1923]|uniref:Transcriptional regulator, CdaR family n=1 Tax=Micromonospora yangpuensis TaxID=683228 RepID=A0A1C6UXN2_9ACTN|nr:transcriptional regulator, CdaR family [Micromonospora yangpuensis]
MSPVFPTVREVLALSSVRHGAPRLVAGEAGLDRPVRWVHVTEVPDIAPELGGGELVLTTGIGLPGADAGLRAFVDALVDVGVSGLVVELGRRYVEGTPRAMVAAAQRRGLPLVELRRATPFVRITEAVHALIVDAQLTELRATEEIHQRFTELSVEGAGPGEVLRQAAELSGCPVVLENLSRQVLGYDPAGEDAEPLLAGWEQHSRRIRPAGRTAYDPDNGWLVTIVGARGQDWGRLLLRWPAAGTTIAAGGAGGRVDQLPPNRLTILVERAASTLALGRLIQRDAEGLERQIHRTLLTALLEHSLPVDEVALRARALGVVLERRHLVGVVVRPRGDGPAGTGDAASWAGNGVAPREAGAIGWPGVGGWPGTGAVGGPGGTGVVGGPVGVGVVGGPGTDVTGGPRPDAGAARLRDLAEAVGQALRETRLVGLYSAVDEQAVGVLLALPDPAAEERALTAFAAALRRLRPDPAPPPPAGPLPRQRAPLAAGSERSAPPAPGPERPGPAAPGPERSGPPAPGPERPGPAAPRADRVAVPAGSAALIVAVGAGVASLRQARHSLVEARQVADAARRDRRDLPIFRLPHIGLAGLLHLLREEPRVQTFVERELAALLAHDARHPRDQLVDTLRAYLEQGRNKSAAAAAAHLSRPAFYERLARISRILDVDLDSVQVCLSLHVALLALDAVRRS